MKVTSGCQGDMIFQNKPTSKIKSNYPSI